MNHIVKLIKLEYRLALSQKSLIIGTIIAAFVMSRFMGMTMFAISFLFMLNYILVTFPFNLNKYYKYGFYNLLPISTTYKVVSRYLYMVINSVLTFVLAFIVTSISLSRKGELFNNVYFYFVGSIVLITIIMSCIQYILNYKIENFSNEMLAMWIRFLPAFMIMFISNAFGSMIMNIFSVKSSRNIGVIIIIVCLVIFVTSMMISIYTAKRQRI